jgi:hypothetical protein
MEKRMIRVKNQRSEIRRQKSEKRSKRPTLNLEHPTSNGQESIACNKIRALLISLRGRKDCLKEMTGIGRILVIPLLTWAENKML